MISLSLLGEKLRQEVSGNADRLFRADLNAFHAPRAEGGIQGGDPPDLGIQGVRLFRPHALVQQEQGRVTGPKARAARTGVDPVSVAAHRMINRYFCLFSHVQAA